MSPSGSFTVAVGLTELPAVPLAGTVTLTVGLAFVTVTVTVFVDEPPFPSLAVAVKMSVLLWLLLVRPVRFGAGKLALAEVALVIVTAPVCVPPVFAHE